MLTKEEFEKEYLRMMDSVRTHDKGEPNCNGVSCVKCSLKPICCNKEDFSFNAFEVIEIVEKWSKEHPIITKIEKFKKVFGVEPKYNDHILCPKYAGFTVDDCSLKNSKSALLVKNSFGILNTKSRKR